MKTCWKTCWILTISFMSLQHKVTIKENPQWNILARKKQGYFIYPWSDKVLFILDQIKFYLSLIRSIIYIYILPTKPSPRIRRITSRSPSSLFLKNWSWSFQNNNFPGEGKTQSVPKSKSFKSDSFISKFQVYIQW